MLVGHTRIGPDRIFVSALNDFVAGVISTAGQPVDEPSHAIDGEIVVQNRAQRGRYLGIQSSTAHYYQGLDQVRAPHRDAEGCCGPHIVADQRYRPNIQGVNKPGQGPNTILLGVLVVFRFRFIGLRKPDHIRREHVKVSGEAGQ